MSVVREACPSCAAPLSVADGATRIKCPYCSSSLAIERHGSEVALALADRVATSIEKSGTQTHDAIKEGSYVTQTELRRLQVAQDLSMVQMRLSNVQSEIRSIERLPATPIIRNQLSELRASEVDLKRQAQTLSDVLNPPSPTDTPSKASSRAPVAGGKGSNVRWLLFSTKGRLSRGGYWLGIIIAFVLFVLVGATSTTMLDIATGEPTSSLSFFGFLLMVLFFWVSIAVSVKRYHDRGKSAWWVLIALIPAIGPLWQFIELGFFPGNRAPNQYT